MAEKFALFELDSDQSNVPPGYTAYILRLWGHVYSGEIVGIDWDDAKDKPVIRWGASLGEQTGVRPARFPAETSRVFVRQGAPIDSRILEREAGPVPDTVPENFSDPAS